MARTRRGQTNQRKNSAYVHTTYVDGNTVRRVQALPVEQERRPREVSQKTRQNREKAMNMSPGFVCFLVLMCCAVLTSCVNYLRMKSDLTGVERNLASLEAEYSQLKADNDAYYSQVSSSANIENIKAIALGRLGMKYATEDQIVTYETERSSYVRQYQDVPGLDR